MATYTPNYNLNKPTFAELADVRTFNGNMDIIDTVMNASQNSIAEPYDSTETYDEGDMVMYELYLYKCLEETTGTWDATKWERAYSASSGAGIVYPQDATKYLNGMGQWTVPAGGGDYYSPVIYSTEEREIGVWTDGKPLYEKTIVYDNQTTISDGYTPIASLSDIDHIDIISGGIINLNDDSYYSLPYVFGNKSTSWYYDNGNLGIRVANDTWSSDWDIFVTIQYTKTTDTAGSGTWTPQGVPAVHYSTDEQVIGTWIDGSTIYQKTFNITTSTSTILPNTTDVDNLISVSGFCSDGTTSYCINYADTSDYVLVRKNEDGTGVGITMSTYFENNVTDYTVTIQYTKVTV